MAQKSTNSNYLQRTISETPVEYEHIASLTLVLVYIVMLLGAYTSAIGADFSAPTGRPAMAPGCFSSNPTSSQILHILPSRYSPNGRTGDLR